MDLPTSQITSSCFSLLKGTLQNWNGIKWTG
jgi:hypothetical protein